MSEDKKKNIILDEKPIHSNDDDKLNFLPFAKNLKRIIQGYFYETDPLTIGIYGKWGTGKTSFLNLIENEIELFKKDKPDHYLIKFRFNPWIYGDSEEMLFDFLQILKRKVVYKDKNKEGKVTKLIDKYGAYLKSMKLSVRGGISKTFNAGVIVDPYEIVNKINKDLKGENKTLEELKNEINVGFKNSKKKIIIFIDDIDRLDKDEVYSLFKIIKTTINFSNIIYIIAMDFEHISNAIYSRYGDDRKAGKDFIEKIINIPLELPLVEGSDLLLFIHHRLNLMFEKHRILQHDIDELLITIKSNHFSNPREVIRVVNSFSVSLFGLVGEVNLSDLFWIEYIKIKYNKIYNQIKNYSYELLENGIMEPFISFNNLYEETKGESGLRLQLKKDHSEAFNIIDQLFPMTRTGIGAFKQKNLDPSLLDQEKRINHPDHFNKYFSFHLKGKLSEVSFKYFLSKINESAFKEAKDILENDLNINENVERIKYKFIQNMDQTNYSELKKIIRFLNTNFSVFTIEDIQIALIRNYAEVLKRYINEKDIEDFTEEIMGKLNLLNAGFFLGRFDYGVEVKNIDVLNNLFIDKVKSEVEISFDRRLVKMWLGIWMKVSKSECEEFLLENLNSRERVISFFKAFVHYWNRSINGSFKFEDYNEIKDNLKLDITKLKDAIGKYFSEQELNNIAEMNSSFDDYSENKGIDIVRQFLFWDLRVLDENEMK